MADDENNRGVTAESESNWTERSLEIWMSLLAIKDRREFESFFKKGQCWGTLIETIHFGIQLYSTKFRRHLFVKSTTTDGALILCSDCSSGRASGFWLRFYKHVDGLWRVSTYRGHQLGCTESDEGNRTYFMKPLQLAMLIKNHHPKIPTSGKEIQQALKHFELYPYPYRKQAVYNLTHNILQYLDSSLPPLPLNCPSIVPTSSRRPRRTKQTIPLAHPELVLRGLTAFSEAFLQQDPDNRIFIERFEGVYLRCTMILGPVVRLSRTHSTGQYCTSTMLTGLISKRSTSKQANTVVLHPMRVS